MTVFSRVRLLGGLFALLLVAAPPAASPLGPARYSAILVDADNATVLYQEAAAEMRHPASITKVMTLFLAFDALDAGRLRLDDRLLMSAHAAAQKPSKLWLAAGRTIGVEDAIRVIAVKSANDIAVAMAERLGGSEAGFARMMTAKARTLGMRQTNFSNATGLPDPATFTSARDLAILSVAMLREHPDYYRFFGTRTMLWNGQSMANHNHLLDAVDGVDGLKTGYTVDAGFTLAASARRGGRRLVAVVMGEPSGAVRDRHVAMLLEAGFDALAERARGGEGDVEALLGGKLGRAPVRLPRAVLAAMARADAASPGETE